MVSPSLRAAGARLDGSQLYQGREETWSAGGAALGPADPPGFPLSGFPFPPDRVPHVAVALSRLVGLLDRRGEGLVVEALPHPRDDLRLEEGIGLLLSARGTGGVVSRRGTDSETSMRVRSGGTDPNGGMDQLSSGCSGRIN